MGIERGDMRKVEWRTGNHMRIDTGHRTFDRQCEYLGTGNVWGTCQTSSYVRPYTETECNGFTNAPGHLQRFDLNQFKDLPSHIRWKVEEMTKTRGGILYEIRHWGTRLPYGGRQKHVHGYILTARWDAAIPYLHWRTWMVSNTQKSYNIMQTVREYISEQV